MLKMCSRMLAIIFAVTMVWAGSAMAYPWIEVEGWVNPDLANLTDNGDGTSTLDVKYIFNVTGDGGSGAEMNYLSLEFENDVFKTVNTFTPTLPSDWSVTFTSSGGSLYELSTAGTTIGVGESLNIQANVTIYNSALTDATLWDEGQVWGQSWFASDTMHGGDGGSTAPVPEPATMILFGIGLIGIAGVTRKTLNLKRPE